jgi:ABC-type branched-subunit amino acid transport system permease subunit
VLPASIASWQPTIFGVLLVIVLIVRPSGLLGGSRRSTARQPRRARKEVSP